MAAIVDPHCAGCGRYQPMRVNETGRVDCGCGRTPPASGLPANIFVCPACGGHAASKLGCWGTPYGAHEHCYMVNVYDLARELRELKQAGAAMPRAYADGERVRQGPRHGVIRSATPDDNGRWDYAVVWDDGTMSRRVEWLLQAGAA